MQVVNTISFQYELLDKYGNFKMWLYEVKSCSIRWQSLTQLKSDATIEMRYDEDIDYANDRVRVYVTKNGKQSVLGTFLLCSTDNTEERNSKSTTCNMYSLLKVLLDTKLEQSYQVDAGTNAINEVKRLIGANDCKIQDSEKTLLSVKTYKIGQSYLEVINDLLDTVNYTPLYTDKMGVFTSKPYTLPQEQEPTFDWKNDINGLIRPQIKRSKDMFNVPNVFVAHTNDINIQPPLRAVYENTLASSETSTVSRGRRIVKTEEVEATCIDDVVAKAKNMCHEANSIFEHIEFEKSLDTDIDYYMPVGYVINEKFVLYNITYTCKVGSKMVIKGRKSLDLFA